MNIETFRQLGFDRIEHVPFTKRYRIGCSCLEVLVINGSATHEMGCPQQMHECNGCNAIIPARQRYCGDCA